MAALNWKVNNKDISVGGLRRKTIDTNKTELETIKIRKELSIVDGLINSPTETTSRKIFKVIFYETYQKD